MKKYLKLMRIHHYIKNLLIFAALACSGQLFDWRKLKPGLAGFCVFCLVSSAVYTINDIKDAEKDKNHPTKCRRPIAAGQISKRNAIIFVFVLLGAAAACSALTANILAAALATLYLMLNLAYSMGLKNMPLIDIAILSAGFFIRVLYGAVITGIEVSDWLYLTVITAALYFALGKRRNERRQLDGRDTRRVLKAYPADYLDRSMTMCLTLTNTFYALWCMDTKTISRYGNARLIFTVPMVLFITMKYGLNIESGSDGDPVEVLLHDRSLLVVCALYMLAMFIMLYN